MKPDRKRCLRAWGLVLLGAAVLAAGWWAYRARFREPVVRWRTRRIEAALRRANPGSPHLSVYCGYDQELSLLAAIGMPVETTLRFRLLGEPRVLEIYGEDIRDLSPLRGLRPELVRLEMIPALAPQALRRLRPRQLSLYGTKIADLSALKGMPLKKLSIIFTPAAKKALPAWLKQSGCQVAK